MKMKKLPIGVSDFKKIIENDYYYEVVLEFPEIVLKFPEVVLEFPEIVWKL